jgi:hypothetical protein
MRGHGTLKIHYNMHQHRACKTIKKHAEGLKNMENLTTKYTFKKGIENVNLFVFY